MSLRRSFSSFLFALALVGTACSSQPESLASTETSTAAGESQERVSNEPVAVETSAPNEVDNNQGQPPVTDEPDVESTTTTTEAEVEETTTVPVPSCTSPAGADRWVDVAINDPDGGLNMREGAGASNAVIWTIPRNTQVVVTEFCETVGSTDWWKVVPVVEADLEGGWVSSSFLAGAPLNPPFEPGLGKAIADTDNIETSAATLEELAAKLAVAYGFDEDVVIMMVGEPEVADAVGGDVTFDLSGLKDDSSNGFRLEIGFHFDKNEDATEVLGVSAKRITNYALCTRGVTEDGLCI